jgi:hypothetical protein
MTRSRMAFIRGVLGKVVRRIDARGVQRGNRGPRRRRSGRPRLAAELAFVAPAPMLLR